MAQQIFTVDSIITSVRGYYLNGVKMKMPKAFSREFVYQKTDYTVITGKQVRDTVSKKEKYLLTFENLTKAQVDVIQTIIDLNTIVLFDVQGFTFPDIAVNVIPYIASKVYDVVGNQYLSSLQLELIEETS